MFPVSSLLQSLKQKKKLKHQGRREKKIYLRVMGEDGVISLLGDNLYTASTLSVGCWCTIWRTVGSNYEMPSRVRPQGEYQLQQ